MGLRLERVFKLMLSGESTSDEADHGDVDHGFARFGIPFVVSGISAVADDPGERAFHDPTLWYHNEALGF